MIIGVIHLYTRAYNAICVLSNWRSIWPVVGGIAMFPIGLLNANDSSLKRVRLVGVCQMIVLWLALLRHDAGGVLLSALLAFSSGESRLIRKAVEPRF